MIQDFGRYNLLCKIGEGGMGSVYLARQKLLKRFCALKVINPGVATKPTLAERFLREARAAAAMSHPNLVNVFDCDQFDGQYFIAMEYIEGLSLGEVLRDHGALPLPLALHWLREAAAALDYAHNKGIIHRDIKPDNMIIDGDAKLRIMDLGLAKSLLEGETNMTMTGYVMGTPHYISPEQVSDAKSADHRSDIYSLGVSFYHMIVGHAPFQRSSVAEICVAHLREAMPSVGLPDPELSAQLDGLIARMTAKNREERLPSMSQVLVELQAWLEASPLDVSSQAFCTKLDLSERTMDAVLKQNGIERSQVDSQAPIRSDTLVSTAVSSKTVVAPGTTTIVQKHSLLPWAIAAAAVVLASGVVAWILTHKQEPPAPAAPTLATAVQPVETPSAKPVPPPTGSLLVTVEPKNALVLFRGQTKPAENGAAVFNELSCGKDPLEVTLPGYRSAKVAVEIVANQTAKQTIALERIAGTAQVQSEPAGADVLVDGQLVGKTPYKLQGGDGEEVRAELRTPGYEAATVTVALKETGTVERVQLARLRPVDVLKAKLATAQNTTAEPLPNEQPANQPVANTGRRDLLLPMQMRLKMTEFLTQARQAAPRWQPGGRQTIQKEIESFLRGLGMPAEHVTAAMSGVMPVLDKAVKLADGEYEQQRMPLVREIMEAFRHATQPPEGGRRPEPPEP